MMGMYFENPACPYKVGYETFPNRKRPQIVIQTGNRAESYGYFRDEESARKWMTLLSALLQVRSVDGDTNE